MPEKGGMGKRESTVQKALQISLSLMGGGAGWMLRFQLDRAAG